VTYPIAELARDIGDIEHSTQPAIIRSKSRDRYGVSPLLREMLKGKTADIVISPKTRDEVLTVARAAVRHRIPITTRGGGTANYGQSVPLAGGISLNMTGLTGIEEIVPGRIRALAGTVMQDMDAEARKQGWELRMHPTTKKEATIGGYVAGGSGGPGSAAYGQLFDKGNVLGAEIVSLEEDPRILRLEGQDTDRINHFYGATGIILSLDMPLAPAWPWRETIVAFREYMGAIRFAIAAANAPGIINKVMSCQGWPTPQLIKPFAPLVPEGCAIVSTMIAEHCWPGFEALVAEHGGAIVSVAAEGEGPYGAPLTEFVFGHALLQIRKSDPRRAGVEGFFRGPDLAAVIEKVYAAVGAEGPMRMELIRSEEGLIGSGSPYFVFENPEQMADLVQRMQDAGASVANSHTSNVRAVGKRPVRDADAAFKRQVDPFGLLNPGRFEAEETSDARFKYELPTDRATARAV
jgi:FAD/FMN-containing dehydrogenase